MDDPIDSLLQTPDVLTQLAVQYGPRVLSALLVLVVGFFVMRWVATFAARGLAGCRSNNLYATFCSASCASSCSSCSC